MLSRLPQGAVGRVLLLLGVVALVLLGSAALAQFAFDEYKNYGDALWSAGLHLLDPSTLHDDEGASQRTIGVFQVVTGLILLVGLLFTFVSEVVGRSLARLGQSDRPVRARDHLLIVGGMDVAGAATAAISRTHAAAGLKRLVVLAPESERDSRDQLRAKLKEAAGDLRADLVFGDTAGDTGFELSAAAEARAILVTASTGGPVVAETADIEVTQSGLALLDYLRERDARPLVRLLFRRGRNVDPCWELFPADWDPLVGDRTVSAILRLAITRPRALEMLPGWVDEHGSIEPYAKLVDNAWERAEGDGRPLRLTIVGCGINAPALMEDLAQVGAERFRVTVIASRQAFEMYLGEEQREDISIHFVESRGNDPARVRHSLVDSKPDLVLVTPSPTTWDLRNSDAGATLSALDILRNAGADLPVVAELFLPETAKRLPDDSRLLAVSGLGSVAVTVALSLFDPPRSSELERQLSAGESDRRQSPHGGD